MKKTLIVFSFYLMTFVQIMGQGIYNRPEEESLSIQNSPVETESEEISVDNPKNLDKEVVGEEKQNKTSIVNEKNDDEDQTQLPEQALIILKAKELILQKKQSDAEKLVNEGLLKYPDDQRLLEYKNVLNRSKVSSEEELRKEEDNTNKNKQTISNKPVQKNF